MNIRALGYLTVGTAILIFLFYWISPSKVVSQASHIPPVSIAAFATSVLGFHLLRSIRWRLFLRAIRGDPALRTVFWTNMIGYGVNSFIPVRFGGELTRAYIIDAKEETGFFPSLSTVAVERVLDLLAIVGLAALGALNYSTALAQLSLTLILVTTGASALLILAVILVGSRNLPAVMWVFSWILQKAPLKNSWRTRILEVIESSLSGAASIGRNYRLLALSIGLSMLIWLESFLGFYVMFLGVGFNRPFSALLLGTMLFQLSFILPSTPGNIGTFEGFFVLFLGGLSLGQADAALAVGVVSHIVNLLIITLLSIAGVGFLGLRFKEVFRIPSRGSSVTNRP